MSNQEKEALKEKALRQLKNGDTPAGRRTLGRWKGMDPFQPELFLARQGIKCRLPGCFIQIAGKGL